MTILAILLLLFLLFLLQAWVYNRFWNRGLSCKIAFREEYTVEEESSDLLEVVTNDKLLPLPVVEIDFHMDKSLQFSDGQNSSVSDRSYRRDVFALSAHQKITRTLQFKCVRRGYFCIGEAGVTAQNILLTRKYLRASPQHTEFYVLPRPFPIGQIEIPFSKVMGAVLSRKRVYDDPFEFGGLREYSRGDPMKYINWKATARAGKLLSNLHESTLDQKVVVLLDMEESGLLLDEAGVRIACSLCERLLLANVEVAVYSNGSDVQTGKPLKLSSVSGAGSLLFLKKKFACVQSKSGLPSIASFFPAGNGGAGEGDLCVLVSQNEAVVEEFSRCAGKQRGVWIIPYREEKRDFPSRKNIDVVWMEV